ncbi:MAG TPA: DUF5110 domain-containing protein [Bacteroidetes bacterium]|nr:DUF5110 domain-containing protein [Bacteroidota bacterium]
MQSNRITYFLICLAGALLPLFLTSCGSSPVRKTSNGIIVSPQAAPANESVRLQVITDRIIRITSVPGKEFPETESLMAVAEPPETAEFSVERNNGAVSLQTSTLQVNVSLETGEVSFHRSDGSTILSEIPGGGKTFEPVTIQGESFYAIRQQFGLSPEEALYGLGGNQTSFMDMRGKNFDLYQYNTQAVVPFLLSTKNYGILWDNYSRSKFGDVRDYMELSSLALYNSRGEPGGLTATYADRNRRTQVYTSREEKEINYQFIPDLVKFPSGYDLNNGFVTWEGYLESDTTGMHSFVFTSAGYARLWIGDSLIFDRWRQCWNTSSNHFDLPMRKGEKIYLKIEWIPDGGESFIALRYLDPSEEDLQNRISLFSEVGKQIDYYFIAGDNMDEVIGGYRTVTGKAPVMPRWAMGFWQSRERYMTQEQLLSTAREFRKRRIPIDNMVLDWQYWPIDKWGDHGFDRSRFPDPDGMVQTLHDSLHAHIMISVWPKYYVGTENFEAMNSRGWLYSRNVEKGQKDWLGYVSTFYDAFNAGAREAYWNQLNDSLFSRGFDAWWLDATEPDICSNLPMEERKALMNPTALGPADQYFNAYSLVQAGGIYQGQRGISPNQRVFILTRSAYAGLQRYSAANWSGDIAARWHDMKAQIPCGVNFSMSGIPFWTMDIGGFAVESRYYNPSPADLEEWRELMTRWYQFGAFCTIFRAHGQYPYREIFHVAPESHPAYQSMLKFDYLRYRLMPYIYSLAGHVWLNDYTLMRGLAMDFPNDPGVFDIGDQYMFGPSLLINPVCEYQARKRSVYLPEGTGWYHLFTGEYTSGGQRLEVPAPLNEIPIFVREGAIIPFGPPLQYAGEKAPNPVTLYVYAGADGEFVLYEDENTNYNYENGAYTLIPLRYNETTRTLTIGERTGSFEGMLNERTFHIVYVDAGDPVPAYPVGEPHYTVQYNGSEINLPLD